MKAKALLTFSMACCLAACAEPGGREGPPGPAGPPGAQGPQGVAGPRGGQFAQPVIVREQDADGVQPGENVDVVISLRSAPLRVLLQRPDQVTGRLITLRAAGRGDIRVTAIQRFFIEGEREFVVRPGEMVTLVAGGGDRWFVISTSDLD